MSRGSTEPLGTCSTGSRSLEFMSRARMIIYIYGPKLDPYHRERWRSPYPVHMLNEFSILVDE